MSILSAIFGFDNQQSDSITLLSPTEFKNQVENKNVQLVDVRTALEFKNGNIKGAKNIDFFSNAFTEQFEKLDKEKPVFVYCRSGVRSRKSAKKLTKMGFTKVFDLEGGFLNYK